MNMPLKQSKIRLRFDKEGGAISTDHYDVTHYRGRGEFRVACANLKGTP